MRSFSKETPFWSAFGLWFEFQPVFYSCKDPTTAAGIRWRRLAEEMEGPTWVLRARRRPESLVWSIPENDRDLLNGVGARENNGSQTDDTFETLLFMALQGYD